MSPTLLACTHHQPPRCAPSGLGSAWLLLAVWILWPVAASALDCNFNEVEDAEDIASGNELDCNGNGVPDECEFVPLLFGISEAPVVLPARPRAVTTVDLDGDTSRELLVGTTSGNDSTLHIFRRQAGVFDADPPIELPTRIVSLVAHDLDDDGDADLIATGQNSIRLFFNDAGVLTVGDELTVSPGTTTMVLADLSDDGKLDIIALNRSQSLLTWFPAQANGGFGAAQSLFDIEAEPNAVAADDFDEDGSADLAVAGSTSGQVTVLKNSGGGASFSPLLTLDAPGVRKLVSGDLDRDGRPDLVAGTLQEMLVWRGALGGSFQEPERYPFPIAALQLQDVDQDGRLDVFLAERDFATLRLLRGTSDGRLLPPQNFSSSESLFALGDFDSDGDVDLALPSGAPDRVTLFFQGEPPQLGFESTRFSVRDRPHHADTGDFNGDGSPDVATANSIESTSTLLTSHGDGSFEEPRFVTIQGFVFGVLGIDLNADGRDDLILGRPPCTLKVFLSREDGSLEPHTEHLNEGATQFLAKADVDGDGHVDVLMPGGGAGTVSVHFNSGTGDLIDRQVIQVGSGVWGTTSGDMNGDGLVDVLAASTNSSDVALALQTAPRRFAEAIRIPVAGNPQGLAVGDFDRDGDLDIATANSGGGTVTILPNQGFLQGGSMAFGAERSEISLEQSPTALVATDLDNDGIPDLVVSNEQSSTLSLLRGIGDGTFAGIDQRRTSGPRITLPTDMDLDGDIDLVAANREARAITVFLNQFSTPALENPFLETLCTALDFETVSTPTAGPVPARRVSQFLTPARNDPILLPTLFPNLRRFSTPWNFLATVFPERFPGWNEDAHLALVGRRETREYHGGRIFLLEDDELSYGFDVSVDEERAGELLSLAETTALWRQLRTSFLIEPLVYFPTTPAAVEQAMAWETPEFPLVFPRIDVPPPIEEATPTFTLAIAENTLLCGVFGEAGTDRGPRDEYDLKAELRLAGGPVTLPTVEDTFDGELIDELIIGPERSRAIPQSPGRFALTRIPGEVTTYRFTFTQPFALPDGQSLDVEIVAPLLFQARGEEPLAPMQSLPEAFFVALKGREPLQARLDDGRFIRFGSCDYPDLTRWSVAAELDDGTSIALDERFDETEREFDTAPASITSGRVRIGTTELLVTDYFSLIYSAQRHNTSVDYWVLFDAPVPLVDIGEVHGIELRAPEEPLRPLPEAAYLGENLERIATLAVREFSRTEIERAAFLRGDAAADGGLDILDGLTLLRFLFQRGTPPGCEKAADANDDGILSIVDAVAIVTQLFRARDPLPAPFPACGQDPTPDSLGCELPMSCP